MKVKLEKSDLGLKKNDKTCKSKEKNKKKQDITKTSYFSKCDF